MELVPSLIGLGAIASGVWALAQGARGALAARAASAWPTVRGRVVSAQGEQRNVGMQGGRGIYREARIAYEYEVGGRRFTGSRVHAGGELWVGSVTAAEVMRRFPAGSELDVYVDPADPANACLDPGGAGWLVNLAVGVPVVLFGTGILLGWWLRR